MTLSATGLSVTRSGRTILHPTSLSIKPGERVGFVGASGSGKSTLGQHPDAARLTGLAISLIGAALTAFALIMVRSLNKTESPGTIAFHFALTPMIGSF